MRFLETLDHFPDVVFLCFQVHTRHVLHNCRHDTRSGSSLISELCGRIWGGRVRNDHFLLQCIFRQFSVGAASSVLYPAPHAEAQERQQEHDPKVSQHFDGGLPIRHGKEIRRNPVNYVVHLPVLFADSPGFSAHPIWLHHLLLARPV